VLVHSYDKSTLLSLSLYVSMFIRYYSCLLNVYPYVSAILVVLFTTNVFDMILNISLYLSKFEPY